jgi:outer membrane protein
MKQIKTLVLVALVYMSSLVTVNAQAAKTAHVDVSEIVSKMPAMLDAQKQLEKLSGTYDTEYKTMVEEYQNKLKKYEQESFN